MVGHLDAVDLHVLPAATHRLALDEVGVVDVVLLVSIGACLVGLLGFLPDGTVAVGSHHGGVLAGLCQRLVVVQGNLDVGRVGCRCIEHVGTLGRCAGIDAHVVCAVGQSGDELCGDKSAQSAAVVGVEVACVRTVQPLSALLAVAVAVTHDERPAVNGLCVRVLDVSGVVGSVGVVVDVLLLGQGDDGVQGLDKLVNGGLVLHLAGEGSLLLGHECLDGGLGLVAGRQCGLCGTVIHRCVGVQVVLQQVNLCVEVLIGSGVVLHPVHHVVVGVLHNGLGKAVALAAVLAQRVHDGRQGLAFYGAVLGQVLLVLVDALLGFAHGSSQTGQTLDVVGVGTVLVDGVVQGFLVACELDGLDQLVGGSHLGGESLLGSVGGSLA